MHHRSLARLATLIAASAAFIIPSAVYAKPSVGSVTYGSGLTAGVPTTLSASVSSAVALERCNLYVDSEDIGTMNISGSTASKSYTFPYARVYTVFVFCKDVEGGAASGANTSIYVQYGPTQDAPAYGGGYGYTPPPPAVPTPVQGLAFGTLIKLACPADATTDHPCKAVYYYGKDGKRHSFPNDKVYFTWYIDFSTVTSVTAEVMGSLPLGKNVTYRPGVKMVKFTSLNNVYAVAKGGVLRWVTSEALAVTLYGIEWNKQIDDIPDTFYTNYSFGEQIGGSTDYSVTAQLEGAPTIDDSI